MLLWLISNYDKVTNRRKTVRWLPGKRTGNSNNSIDWMRWIIKPEINRARGYTQLYDFLCSLAESWFFTKLSIVLRKNSDADWDFSRCRLGIWEFSLDWESTVLGIWEFSFDWESTVYRYFIKKEENRWTWNINKTLSLRSFIVRINKICIYFNIILYQYAYYHAWSVIVLILHFI